MSITNKLTIGYIAVVTAICACLMAFAMAGNPAASTSGMPTPLVSVEEQVEFLDLYEKEMGAIDSDQEDGLVASGMALCSNLRFNNYDMPTAWRAGVDELGYSSDQSAAILNSAVRAFCPLPEGY